ncbi:hypothetical protein ACTXT7_014739 [Hymenolepis weldensis]
MTVHRRQRRAKSTDFELIFAGGLIRLLVKVIKKKGHRRKTEQQSQFWGMVIKIAAMVYPPSPTSIPRPVEVTNEVQVGEQRIVLSVRAS